MKLNPILILKKQNKLQWNLWQCMKNSSMLSTSSSLMSSPTLPSLPTFTSGWTPSGYSGIVYPSLRFLQICFSFTHYYYWILHFLPVLYPVPSMSTYNFASISLGYPGIFFLRFGILLSCFFFFHYQTFLYRFDSK